jgi:hypothetical protein
VTGGIAGFRAPARVDPAIAAVNPEQAEDLLATIEGKD